jgi:nitrogenase molybdenum-iron protein alpha/beta subunit
MYDLNNPGMKPCGLFNKNDIDFTQRSYDKIINIIKCYNHPETDAVGTCSTCGKGICKDSAV